jgi:hypothetical protein
MTYYPDDILTAAEEAASSCFSGTSIKSKQGKLAITAALASERERAAKICDARLPLYKDIGQINADKECASSTRGEKP